MSIFRRNKLFQSRRLAFAPIDPLDDGLYDMIERERRESGSFYDHLASDDANFSWLDSDHGGLEFSSD